MKDSILSYSVGPLLYCPANRADLALSVQQEKFGRQYSLALCLEDTINDRFLAQAEEMFLCTLTRIYTASQTQTLCACTPCLADQRSFVPPERNFRTFDRIYPAKI